MLARVAVMGDDAVLAITAEVMTATISHVRFVELEGGLNFRDMGGYVADNGRTIKWRTLFRSGTTLGMTEQDLEHIASFGIRFSYDLRSNGERRRHPNLLQNLERIEYRYLDHDRLPGDLVRAASEPAMTAEEARGKMLSLYRQLPYTFRDAYRNLFLHLANGDLPLVFNCTAGKDRTGAAAALILTALGVEREVVFEDYLLTSRCFERSYKIIFNSERLLLGGVRRDVWDTVLRADPTYLKAMFDHLDAEHGSVMNYLTTELALDSATVDAMQRNLLQ